MVDGNLAVGELLGKYAQTAQVLAEQPFYEKFEITGGDSGVETLYVVKVASLDLALDPDEVSTLVGWTAPLPTLLKNTTPGKRAVLDLSRGRSFACTLGSRASFGGGVVPEIDAAEYVSRDVTLRFNTLQEREQLALTLRSGRPLPRPAAPDKAERARREKAYEASGTFGLGEIIVEADAIQRAAMQLPYDRHVVLEGPPGSGKSSVALMRVAVLIHEQFDYFGINRDERAAWRYQPEKTRVLVRHEPMVAYLTRGLSELKVQGVRTETLASFLNARTGGLVAGGLRAESANLARLKALPAALDLAWEAFRRQAQTNMNDAGTRIFQEADRLGEAGATVREATERWVDAIVRSPLVRTKDGRPILPATANFARRFRPLVRSLQTLVSREKATEEQTAAAGRLIRAVAAEVVPRVNRLAALFDVPQLVPHALEAASGELGLSHAEYVAAMDEWREQVKSDAAGRSEADVALAACLASAMARVDAVGGFDDWPDVLAGAAGEDLTHVVIDEAQDLTPVEALAVRCWAAVNAVITAVGDLRQCVDPGRGVRAWKELCLPRAKRKAFKINYRQSWNVGQFVIHLHQALFGDKPGWSVATNAYGPKPRLRPLVGDDAPTPTQAVAAEVCWMREQVPNATVAVVVDDELSGGRVDDLTDTLIDEIDALGIEVDVEPWRENGVQRTGCVLLLRASQTKGLEFDGVVILGHAAAWTRRFGDVAAEVLTEPQRVARNRLYVAASRARQLLSLVTTGRPKLLRSLENARLCDVA